MPLTPIWSVHIKRSLTGETEEKRFIDRGKIFGTKIARSTTWQTTTWPPGTVLVAPPASQLRFLFSIFAILKQAGGEELVSHSSLSSNTDTSEEWNLPVIGSIISKAHTAEGEFNHCWFNDSVCPGSQV